MEKEEVLIFGAGSAGESFLKKNKEYEVLAVLDNDELKVGKYIQGKQIISLNDLSNYSFKKIIITSAYFPEITRQLLNDYNIPKEKIKMAPKNLTGNYKSYRPFECKNTLKLAEETLITTCGLLRKNNILYFVDHGTLLGLIRDGAIIPWDDDIDIVIHREDMVKVLDIIQNNINFMPKNRDLNWKITEYYSSEDLSLRKILIFFKNNKDLRYNQFPLSIESFIFKDGYAIQELSYAPEKHYLKNEYIMYKGVSISVPYKYKDYLSFHYGNWQKIKKDTSFLDAKNYKIPEVLKIKN